MGSAHRKEFPRFRKKHMETKKRRQSTVSAEDVERQLDDNAKPLEFVPCGDSHKMPKTPRGTAGYAVGVSVR